jgi:hypothetical protein
MSPALELVVDGSRVTQKALSMPDQARAVTITSPDSYQRACDFLKGVKALREEIAETFDPHIKRAYDSHRALCAEKKDAEAPLAEAERIVKTALVAWDTEQERIRLAEQRRLEAEAKRQEEDRRISEAEYLSDQGAIDEADALLDAPIDVPVVAIAPTTPKVSGIAYRETWSAKVTDLHALVKFVAANPSHLGLLQASLPALNAQARSLKAQMRIPGVQAIATKDVAAGRR